MANQNKVEQQKQGVTGEIGRKSVNGGVSGAAASVIGARASRWR